MIDLEEQALEITRQYLFNKTSLKELGKIYDVAPSTIYRKITRWINENRFDIVDTTSTQKLDIDDSLGEKLVRKTGLWRARVVRILGVEKACEQFHEEDNKEDIRMAYIAGDNLHKNLGAVGAELIHNKLRRNMTIGLASGRGVGFAIMKFGELAKKSPSWISGYESIRLVSLCGGARVATWEMPVPRDLDADENVFDLAGILKTPLKNISYVNGPISITPDEHQRESSFQQDLDLAIIGLGQLNTNHHYFRYCDVVQLRAIAQPLRRIQRWQSEKRGFSKCIAEIVHRLYPRENENPPQKFLRSIKDINKAILAVSPKSIKNANEVILIAGGKQKIDVLQGLLTRGYPEAPIELRNLTLITDSWTAEEVLRRISDRSKSPTSRHNPGVP